MPPLNALRAFEAAARLGGFSLAAAELGVTPGAITAHVKVLEAELGAALFVREARRVALTPLGRRVLPELVAAFDQVGQAVQLLRAEAAPRTVHIATLPAIAQLWLSPRLPSIRAALPGITVSITALEQPPNLKRTPYDLCLFYGGGRGQVIAPDVIFPVCAPELAKGLRHPADLLNVPCLTDTAWAGDWAAWAEAAMPGQPFAPRGPVFSLYALALEEAAHGAGVLIGHAALVRAHLDRGTLIAPFAQTVELPRALTLWQARPARAGTAAQRVASMLTDQAKAASSAISTMSPKDFSR